MLLRMQLRLAGLALNSLDLEISKCRLSFSLPACLLWTGEGISPT